MYRYNSISGKHIVKNCYRIFFSATVGLKTEKKIKGHKRN